MFLLSIVKNKKNIQVKPQSLFHNIKLKVVNDTNKDYMSIFHRSLILIVIINNLKINHKMKPRITALFLTWGGGCPAAKLLFIVNKICMEAHPIINNVHYPLLSPTIRHSGLVNELINKNIRTINR